MRSRLVTRGRIVGLAVIAVIAAIVTTLVVLHPVDVTYRLWRHRSDPDPYVWQPPLCAKGPSVLPHLYEAFEKHGARDDVEGFRVAIAATLRCIRYQQVPPIVISEHVYSDAPADPKLFDTIVRAFNQEPDGERRGAMLTFMWELDFRARFAIWAGISSGPQTIPYPWDRIPSIDPYDKRTGFDRETIRAEWCRVVAPVVWKRIEAGLDHAMSLGDQRRDAVFELAAADCTVADRARLIGLANFVVPMSSVAYGFVRAAGTSPDRVRALLVPLYADAVPCRHQVDAFNGMLGALDPSVAAIIAEAQGRCVRDAECSDVGDCRAQLVTRLTKTR
jgi:hypothetical protein